MSPRLPRLTAKELVAILKRDGFLLMRSRGSHQTFYHKTKQLHVTVPVHLGKIIGPGLLNTILKQAQISRDVI